MSWKGAINFRYSIAYVEDPADETCAKGDGGGGSNEVDVYDTLRNGLTFGYPAVFAAETRDRNAGIDRRLAGTHFTVTTPTLFRLDLPATGDYLCRAAFGDFYSGRDNASVEVLDDATVLFSIDHATGWTTGGNRWRDANDVLHDSADVTWLDSETRLLTFASTICRVRLGATGREGYIAHFSLEQVVEGGAQGGAFSQVIHRVRGYGRWT